MRGHPGFLVLGNIYFLRAVLTWRKDLCMYLVSTVLNSCKLHALLLGGGVDHILIFLVNSFWKIVHKKELGSFKITPEIGCLAPSRKYFLCVFFIYILTYELRCSIKTCFLVRLKSTMKTWVSDFHLWMLHDHGQLLVFCRFIAQDQHTRLKHCWCSSYLFVDSKRH